MDNFKEWFQERNKLEKKSVIVVNRRQFKECVDIARDADDVVFISISASEACARHYFEDMEEASHYFDDPEKVLNLNFDDVVEDMVNRTPDGTVYVYPAISEEQAAEACGFIKKHIGKHFVIHCRAGKSRSQGVARAIYDLLPDDYEPNIYNKENPCITPNYDVTAKIKRVAYMETFKEEKKSPSVWFCADLHLGHKNILKHCPQRVEAFNLNEADENVLEEHDRKIIEMWNSRVRKEDVVYILGDFSMSNSEHIVKRVMPKLKGNKYLIVGNHDKSSVKLTGYFKDIRETKKINFKKKAHPFIEEEEGFNVFLCHYPMLSWDGKPYGVAHLHGHCHGRIDDYNKENTDLRVDVGLDGRLADYSLVSLEQVYAWFKEKTGGKSGLAYVDELRKEKDTENSVL